MARKAHCIGCGVTFPKMHLMINHRRNMRCGGRFLPADERAHYTEATRLRQAALREDNEQRRILLNTAKLHTDAAVNLRTKRGSL